MSEIARKEITRQTTITNIDTVNSMVKQNLNQWLKEEPPSLALLNGEMGNATMFIQTDATGLNPPTDDYAGDLDFEIKVSAGTKSKEAHVSNPDLIC